MKKIRLSPLAVFTAAIFLLSLGSVWAQSVPVSGNNLSGTIATTNTFQAVQARTNNRIGCSMQNNASIQSGDLMYVYFDKTNSSNCSAATIGGSVTLQPGQPTSCAVGSGYVLKDQVCITGTSSDPFFANFQ
jgi:hypothetical protein